jgi:adenylate kinase family enzyme
MFSVVVFSNVINNIFLLYYYTPAILFSKGFEVLRAELEKRLKVRGRLDDTTEVIEERLNIYRKEIYPILTYLTDQKVRIAHIEGTGTVGQVHDRIEAELQALKLTTASVEHIA